MTSTLHDAMAVILSYNTAARLQKRENQEKGAKRKQTSKHKGKYSNEKRKKARM